jgi:hypothetical protein
MKAGAKSIGRDVAGRVRSTLGGASTGAKSDDVWETATTEELTDEPPECQWCPICRAARRYRDSGGSSAPLGGQFAGMGDTLAGLTRDAFSLFDAALRPPQRPQDQSGTGRQGPASPPPGDQGHAADHPGPPSPPPSDHGAVVVGPGIGWPTVVHPQHEDDEAADERGDSKEGGEPGDGVADGGTDEQVERTAE